MNTAPDNDVLLRANGIAKAFGGIQALQDVSMTIRRGEIYGLIGPNGAGKTTFFNVLTGLYGRDAGRIEFNGMSLGATTPDAAVRAGIARTFQNIRLFANLSVLENVMIGRHARTHAGVFAAMLRLPSQQREERAIEARARELLDFTGLANHANTRAASLPYGQQRRLEIARALATDPQLLALDEPAAGMNATETHGLAELIRSIRARGITVLLIEHDMKFVMSLCDRILVLDYGITIAEGAPADVRANPAVIAAYLGAEQVGAEQIEAAA
jgi:branched-chain amino acid transport system ATP-binding protein